jgi:hypothetical protein
LLCHLNIVFGAKKINVNKNKLIILLKEIK